MEWNSKKIKAFRKKLGLTQGHFGALLGISHVLISYWERDESPLSKISQIALTYLAEREGVSEKELEEMDVEEKLFIRSESQTRWGKEKIKAFREKLDLNQTEFASRLGRDASIVSKWESSKASPGKESCMALKELAEKFSIDLDKFFSETGDARKFTLECNEGQAQDSTSHDVKSEGENDNPKGTFSSGDPSAGVAVSNFPKGEPSIDDSSGKFVSVPPADEGNDSNAEEESSFDNDSSKDTDTDDTEDCDDSSKEEESSLTSESDTNTSSTSNRGGANFTSSPSARSAKSNQRLRLMGRLTHDFLPEPNIRIVGSGIDKLYLGFYVEVNEKLLKDLEAAKADASNSSFREGLISIGENTFTIKPYRQERYPYILENGDMWLQVAEGNADSYPSVYVQMESLYILSTGVDKAVNEVRSFISSNFGEIKEEKVSRVEMYVDVAGEKVYQGDVDKFVGRAVIRRFYQVYGEFTGFELGKGDIRAKVYNKKKEIKKSHKEYMYDMWDLIEEDEEVWRIEFSLSRRALKEWDVEDYDSFKEVIGDIWKYLTEEWLSMREQDNENQTRRSLTELWEEVRNTTQFFGKVTGAIRNKKRIGEIEHCISQMKGCATAVSARQRLSGEDGSFDGVFSFVTTKIREQLAGKAGGKALTEEEIKALSDILFEQEALRKAVNCK